MLMIRMQRTGRRNDPAFRIVALEKTSSPKAGTYTDLLGTYNPRTKAITVAGDRVKKWISQGAQLSPSLSNLLIKNNVIEGKIVNVLPKKTPIKKDAPAEEAVPAASATPAIEPAPSALVAEETAAAVPVVEDTPVVEEAAPEAPVEETPAVVEEVAASETSVETPVEAEAPAE